MRHAADQQVFGIVSGHYYGGRFNNVIWITNKGVPADGGYLDGTLIPVKEMNGETNDNC